MSIVVISPFDPIPSDNMRPGRFIHLCESLLLLNKEVIWITSDFSHSTKSKRSVGDLRLLRYKILLVKTIPYNKNIGIMRILNHIFFAFSTIFLLLNLAKKQKIDGVICANPPLMINFFISLFSKYYKIKSICDVNDIWPEAFSRFTQKSFLTSFIFKVLINFRKLTLRNFTAITAVSTDYIDLVSNEIPKETLINVFPLGHDFDEYLKQIDSEWNEYHKLDGQIWAIYVGTISKNYDLLTIIDCAKYFEEITFFLVGTGEDLLFLYEYSKNFNIENVVFTGFLDYRNMCNLLDKCDIGLLTVSNKAFIRFPNKCFDYFAAGLKILSNISEGEVSRFLLSNRVGETYIEGDPSSLHEKLNFLVKNNYPEKMNIRQITMEYYHSKYIYSKFAHWANEVFKH